jgi:hypothetical protein
MEGIGLSSKEVYEIAKELNLNVSEKALGEILEQERESIRSRIKEIIADKLEDITSGWK